MQLCLCVATDCRLIELEEEKRREREMRAKIEGPGSSEASDEKQTEGKIRQEYDENDNMLVFSLHILTVGCGSFILLCCFRGCSDPRSALYNLYIGTLQP